MGDYPTNPAAPIFDDGYMGQCPVCAHPVLGATPTRRVRAWRDRQEAARSLACQALENIPTTHPAISAAVMLKYRSVVAYDGSWSRRA